MSKLIQNGQLKKLLNKKILLGFTAIACAIGVIAITSFIPFVITKAKLTTAKFWTDELIIVAIVLFTMLVTMFVGQASNAQNPNSEIAKAKVKFVATLGTIVDMNAFCQWIKKVLQPNDIQSIKERELRKIGIDNYEILNLEDREIVELSKNAQRYNGKYYSRISEKQAQVILELKDGVKRIHLVEPGYYLTVSSIETDRTDSEKSGKEQFVKTIRLLFSIISKVIITLIPAVIFAALARDLNAESVDKAQVWATFIARLFALISSAFMGYIVGCQMNDIDADYINLKSRIHEKYTQDKNFVPETAEERAKKEYIERVKRENEEYSKSLGFNENQSSKNLPTLVQ